MRVKYQRQQERSGVEGQKTTRKKQCGRAERDGVENLHQKRVLITEHHKSRFMGASPFHIAYIHETYTKRYTERIELL